MSHHHFKITHRGELKPSSSSLKWRNHHQFLTILYRRHEGNSTTIYVNANTKYASTVKDLFAHNIVIRPISLKRLKSETRDLTFIRNETFPSSETLRLHWITEHATKNKPVNDHKDVMVK